jgi:hypothetical protein
VRKRRAIQYPALTSMLDVLFILLFAALIQATALEQVRDAEAATALAALAPPPPSTARPLPLAAAQLHGRAVAALEVEVRTRRPVVARIAADGTLRELEVDGVATPLGVPLVEPDADADVRLAYLGDRSPELRVCTLVALKLGLADLRHELVVIAPDAPIDALRRALARGLQQDVQRCQTDQGGLAVVIEPGQETP